MASVRRHLICCIVDKRFLRLARPFLLLLRRNYPEHPEVVVCTVDLPPQEVASLERLRSVRCLPLGVGDFQGMPLMPSHKSASSTALYGRFEIWRLFPEYDNVVFLDIDTLVLGSLTEILSHQGFLFFRDVYSLDPSVQDAIVKDPSDRELIRMTAEDGISIPLASANAGVFVVPNQLRTAREYSALVGLGVRYKAHLKWADQSLLNIWAASKAIEISDRLDFNFQYSLLSPAGVPANVRVVHLNGMHRFVRLVLMWLVVLTQPLDRHLRLFATGCWLWNRYGDTVTSGLSFFRSRER